MAHEPHILELEWSGQTLELLPERAVYWARRQTLLIADLHLGKSAAFRRAGLPVPDSCRADLDRLSQLIRRFQVQRLVVLGDFFHARMGLTPDLLELLAQWRSIHPPARLDVLIIRGNHDQSAGDPPESLGFRLRDEPHADPDDQTLCFAHYPPVAMDPANGQKLDTPGPRSTSDKRDRLGKGILCGHLHPSIRLSSSVRSLRVDCFWIRDPTHTDPGTLVLPAFGAFTGSSLVRPRPGDRIAGLADDSVINIPVPMPATPLPNHRVQVPMGPRGTRTPSDPS